jgi:tRNA threonylcarbamoyl adenosine modification protein YeaZ
MKQQNILFLDSSQGITSICALIDGEILPDFVDNQPSRQAELLVSNVADYITLHGIKWHDLTAIGCINGVGGFTSVRIGVASVRGFALAADLRSFGVDMLQVMAYYGFKQLNYNDLICALPAGNAFVAYQHFVGSHCNFAEMQVVDAQYFQRTQVICTNEKLAVDDDLIFPTTRTAQLALQMCLRDGIEHLTPPVPLYARPADAKVGKALLNTD